MRLAPKRKRAEDMKFSVKSFDNKIRYNRPTRMFILNNVRDILFDAGFRSDQVYLCMED